METINVYLFPIKKISPKEIVYYEKFFPKRFKKADNFLFEDDKLRSIGVGILLKEILGISEKEIEIDDFGKPFCKSIEKNFSISHSGDYVVLAVGNKKTGVDIEKKRILDDKILKYVLTEEELLEINENSNCNFPTLWTLKESLSKAVGIGLSMDYKKINVLPFLNNESVEYDKTSYFGKSTYFSDYTLSVCYEEEFNIKILDFRLKRTTPG